MPVLVYMLDLIYVPGGKPETRVPVANKLASRNPHANILLTGASPGLRSFEITDARKAYTWLSSKVHDTPEKIIQIDEGVDAYSNVVFASEVIENMLLENKGKFSIGVAVDSFYQKRLFKQFDKVFGKQRLNDLEIVPVITNYKANKADILLETLLDNTFEREYARWMPRPKINKSKSHKEALFNNHIGYREDKTAHSLYDLILTYDMYLNK